MTPPGHPVVDLGGQLGQGTGGARVVEQLFQKVQGLPPVGRQHRHRGRAVDALQQCKRLMTLEREPVALRNDSGEPSGIGDHQVANAVADHGHQAVEHVRFSGDGHEVRAHHPAHGLAGVHSGGNDAADDVGLGDDAHGLACFEHHQGTDGLLGHPLGRLPDGRVGGDADPGPCDQFSDPCIEG